MSYRRRMEFLRQRNLARVLEERYTRELYYSHRLKLSEEILSRFFEHPVNLIYKDGWVKFHGKSYRIESIEHYAMECDARLQEASNDIHSEVLR